MNTLHDFTNDQLIALSTSQSFVPLTVINAANEELLKRLTSSKQPIDSIMDVPAIKKEIDDVHCMIKDLHERCNQTATELLKLKDIERRYGPGTFQTDEINTEKDLAPTSTWSDREMELLADHVARWILSNPRRPGPAFAQFIIKDWKEKRK